MLTAGLWLLVTCPWKCSAAGSAVYSRLKRSPIKRSAAGPAVCSRLKRLPIKRSAAGPAVFCRLKRPPIKRSAAGPAVNGVAVDTEQKTRLKPAAIGLLPTRARPPALRITGSGFWQVAHGRGRPRYVLLVAAFGRLHTGEPPVLRITGSGFWRVAHGRAARATFYW